MKYSLLNNSSKGVLIDRTPIMGDIRDTYEVSFLLPENGSYIALFNGIDNIEYKKQIINGVCKIPKELIGKEQYVQLVVSQISEDNILQSWECEPIKVTALLNMRRSQWQLSGGMTDRDCFNRIIEIEKVHAKTLVEFDELKTAITKFTSETTQVVQTLKQGLNEAENALARLKEDNAASAAAYNKAKVLLGGE